MVKDSLCEGYVADHIGGRRTSAAGRNSGKFQKIHLKICGISLNTKKVETSEF